MLVLLTLALVSFARPPASQTLSGSTVANVFKPSVLKRFNIKLDIYKSYTYRDRLGKHYVVLCEDNLEDQNAVTKIKAYGFILKNKQLSLEWQMRDFYNPKLEESSISFWTRYMFLEDLDEDGVVEPIITYGTLGPNYYDDGRIKFLIYYKNKKVAIRHQNSTLDFMRNTQVDGAYYKLAVPIQKKVHAIMMDMTKNSHAIFPYGWQNAMKHHKKYFDENGKY